MSRHRSEFTIWTKAENRHLIRVELTADPVTGKRRRLSKMVRGTKADAKKIARRLLAERDQGVELSPKNITMADWLTRWLQSHHMEGHINDTVHERYKGIIKGHLIPRIGSIPVAELRGHHISELKASWLTGQNSTTDSPLRPATVYKHLTVLRKALADAVKGGLMMQNPGEAVESPSLKGREEQRALDGDEISELVRAAAGTRYDVPVRFTLATGLRRGELLSLKWEGLDLDRGLLHCRGTKSAKSRRTIELSAQTVEFLRVHKQAQLQQRVRLGPAWHDSGHVFPTSVGTPWASRIFYRDYKKVVARSDLTGIGSICWHTLRHSAASQWILQGVDIFTVSRRLGHASAAFTMDVYGHLLKGQQKQAAEALDHLLAPMQREA